MVQSHQKETISLDNYPSASEPVAERRRFPRQSYGGPVSFRALLNPHQSYVGALTHDISVGGLQMKTDQFISRGSRVVLEMKLPGQPKPMRTISQVVWVRKGTYSSGCNCGLEFVAITAEDRDAVAWHVERGVLGQTQAA